MPRMKVTKACLASEWVDLYDAAAKAEAAWRVEMGKLIKPEVLERLDKATLDFVLGNHTEPKE